jgi:hypothetical protein
LPGDAPQQDKDGFEDQGKGEAAEGAKVNFWSALGTDA